MLTVGYWSMKYVYFNLALQFQVAIIMQPCVRHYDNRCRTCHDTGNIVEPHSPGVLEFVVRYLECMYDPYRAIDVP